jgi:hypothetical protein
MNAQEAAMLVRQLVGGDTMIHAIECAIGIALVAALGLVLLTVYCAPRDKNRPSAPKRRSF